MGQMGGLQADAWSAQVLGHVVTARAAFHNREDDAPADQGSAPFPIRIGSRPESIGGSACGHCTSDRGAPPTPICFPLDNFKHSLTLFSKSFSFFPRVTFSLSVSRPYLTLDGSYSPLGVAFLKQPNSVAVPRGAIGSGHDGELTLSSSPFQETWARFTVDDASPDYNSNGEAARF